MHTRNAETPNPTHDAQRDISASSEEQFDYNLTVEQTDAPEAKTSYGDVQLGQAEREDIDLVEPTPVRLMARSGNAHWDGEDDEQLADGDELGLQEDRSGPDPGMPVAAIVSVVAIGLLAWLLLKKDR